MSSMFSPSPSPSPIVLYDAHKTVSTAIKDALLISMINSFVRLLLRDLNMLVDIYGRIQGIDLMNVESVH